MLELNFWLQKTPLKQYSVRPKTLHYSLNSEKQKEEPPILSKPPRTEEEIKYMTKLLISFPSKIWCIWIFPMLVFHHRVFYVYGKIVSTKIKLDY